jgi:hypothetical protein
MKEQSQIKLIVFREVFDADLDDLMKMRSRCGNFVERQFSSDSGGTRVFGECEKDDASARK